MHTTGPSCVSRFIVHDVAHIARAITRWWCTNSALYSAFLFSLKEELWNWLYMKHTSYVHTTFYMEVNWSGNWCWREVSTVYYICTYCIFTWYGRFSVYWEMDLLQEFWCFFVCQEYMDNAHMPALPSSDMSSVRPDSPPILKKSNSDHSLYGTDIVIEDQRQLIKGLGDHVICGKYFCVGCWCSSKICNFQPVWFQIHRVSVRINIFIICGFTSKRYIILSRRRIVFATSCEIVFHRTVIMITLHYEIFLQDLNYSGD